MPKTPRISPSAPRTGSSRAVELLVFSGVQLLDVAGPLQVFATANEIFQGGSPPYVVRVVSAGGGSIGSSAGLALTSEPLPAGGVEVDTLIVAGGPGVNAAAGDAGLVDWVRRRAGQARRCASVCSGALLLAASGVLDGRRATTHWARCAELARRYPAVRVEPDPIFVRDGATWTSAGVTAGIDLTLALVEEDCGRALALAVARHLVMFLKRPGGQAQFSATLALQDDGRFEALHGWMAGHLDEALSLRSLAARAGMSERSFSRHYAASTGETPARAVERMRVEAARTLLSDSSLPVKRVAQRCGFGSEETMRRSFFRMLATTPQEYRARFGT